jgi:large subunit ribosomal protein L18
MFKKMKRRKKQKTDYAQRLGILKSGKSRIVIRRNLKNIHIQIINYEYKGDRTVTEAFSKHLKKYGWGFHGGNIPSAYLTGFLAGLKASKNNIKEAVLDSGLHISVRGNGIYAAAAGVRDAGISIPIGNVVPTYKRISGFHVAEFAKKLKSESNSEYKKKFSFTIKNGSDPEKMPEVFEEVRKKIAEDFGSNIVPLKKDSPSDEPEKTQKPDSKNSDR